MFERFEMLIKLAEPRRKRKPVPAPAPSEVRE